MPELVFEARPLSRADIVRIATQFRSLFGLDGDPYLPVTRIVEHLLPLALPGYEFDVCSLAEMGGRHGYWNPVEKTLALREDVYTRLVAHEGRDRSTAMHEVGHALLHTGTLNRAMPGAVPLYRNPEWQAQTFSAAALMPPPMVAQCKSIQEVTVEFGVTKQAAEVWIRLAKIVLTK